LKSITNQCNFSCGRSGIGVCGDNQTLFYAEVTDNMKVGKGKENKLNLVIDIVLFVISM